jgi:hypothetical protein
MMPVAMMCEYTMFFLMLKGWGKDWTGSYTKRLWKTQFSLGKSPHRLSQDRGLGDFSKNLPASLFKKCLLN